MELEDVLFVVPWLVLAFVFHLISLWKKNKGQRLYAVGKAALTSGDAGSACDSLLRALWKANEEPPLEREILSDLGRLYNKVGIRFCDDDYEILICQFERLSAKGSHKALSELQEVQSLKEGLIGQMHKCS